MSISIMGLGCVYKQRFIHSNMPLVVLGSSSSVLDWPGLWICHAGRRRGLTAMYLLAGRDRGWQHGGYIEPGTARSVSLTGIWHPNTHTPVSHRRRALHAATYVRTLLRGRCCVGWAAVYLYSTSPRDGGELSFQWRLQVSYLTDS